MLDAVTITAAQEADLGYLLDRLRKYSNQVGFIRRTNLEDLIRLGTVWIARVHGQHAGAVICSGGIRRPLCFRANLVERELWDQGFGTLFTRRLLQHPAAHRFGGVRVRTREDLQRQITINRKAGGVVVAHHPAGCRGHRVSEWWMPSGSPVSATLPGTYQTSDPDLSTQQGASPELEFQASTAPERLRA